MLKYLISCWLIISSVYNLLAQGIKFEKGTWEAVLAKAEQENKPIFVDAYTTWCGPCKWMAKEVFTQKEVGAYINAHFVAYKMDMEKGDGPAFAVANKVNAFPTLLYFDSQGLLLHKAAGARNAEQLLKLCEDAMDPSKQVGSYHKRYKEGVRDGLFLKQYVEILAEAGEAFEEPFDLYWKTLTAEERHSEEMLGMLAGITADFSDVESPWTSYFLQHRVAYTKNVEEVIVDYYALQAYIYNTYYLAQMEDNAETKAKIETLLTLFPEARSEFKARWDFYRAALETPPSANKIKRLRKRYLKVTIDMDELDRIAYDVLTEGIEDKKELREALKYVNRSVGTYAWHNNLYIQARLLSKLGKKKEAILAAEKALEEARVRNLNEEDLVSIKALLRGLGALEVESTKN